MFEGILSRAPEVACLTSQSTTCFGLGVEVTKSEVNSGFKPSKYAVRPATWGDAIDVPEIVFVAVLEPIQADNMSFPCSIGLNWVNDTKQIVLAKNISYTS